MSHRGSVGTTVVDGNGIATQPKIRERPGRGLGALGLLAGATLMLSTGCTALGLGGEAPRTETYAVDPSAQFVVVTVGGTVAATPGPGVAPTIPESTPMPRIEPPARSAPSGAAARPAASPALSLGNPAARTGSP